VIDADELRPPPHSIGQHVTPADQDAVDADIPREAMARLVVRHNHPDKQRVRVARSSEPALYRAPRRKEQPRVVQRQTAHAVFHCGAGETNDFGDTQTAGRRRAARSGGTGIESQRPSDAGDENGRIDQSVHTRDV